MHFSQNVNRRPLKDLERRGLHSGLGGHFNGLDFFPILSWSHQDTAQLPHRDNPVHDQWICSDFGTYDRGADGTERFFGEKLGWGYTPSLHNIVCRR